MGWMLNKRRLNMSGESVMMQLFLKDNMEIYRSRSSEVDFYIFLLSWFLSVVDIYNKLLDTILTYA